MANLYTPQSNTSQGINLQNFQNILDSITNAPPSTLKTASQNVAGNLMGMAGAQQDYTNNAKQDLINQAQIPQMVNQSADLGKMFSVWLADQNLAGKYASNNSNLANGAGFQGFTNPNLVTQAMQAPATGVNSMMNLVNTAIGSQNKLVGDKTQLTADNYQSGMNMLQTLLGYVNDERTRQEKLASGAGLSTQIVDLNGKKVLINSKTGEIIKEYGESNNDSVYIDNNKKLAAEKVDELIGLTGPWTVGLGNYLSAFPATPARDFQAKVDSLKSNIAFGQLAEMREASKTGGALGQVSNIEEQMLQNSLAAIEDLKQSPEAYKAELNKIKNILSDWEQQKATYNYNTTSVGMYDTNKNEVFNKLKNAGYTDAQIKEYFQLKGL